MFKGLRTKIETEQKVQNEGSNLASNISQASTKNAESGSLIPNKPQQHPVAPGEPSSNARKGNAFSNQRSPTPLADPGTQLTNQTSHEFGKPDTIAYPLNENSVEHVTETLEQRISRLGDQLRTVMRERDECNDQNAQLYQLIEKLRRSLEKEREENSSLRSKLKKIEEKSEDDSDRSRVADRNNSISIKSFKLNELSKFTEGKANEVEILRQELVDLQAQLAKSNRMLKIKQQNFNDLKRTLHKELLDHGKTQEALKELRKQVEEQDNHHEAQSAPQNGTIPDEVYHNKDSKQDNNQIFNSSVQNNRFSSPQGGPGGSGASLKGTAEDSVSLSAMGNCVQLDRLSYLSRSSASVNEFDSNDIDQININREVNQEYLKNVLFRYMTSTDNETTQHLVKAISVLMDFSPEQLAAIKSAMHARSSWLRLK